MRIFAERVADLPSFPPGQSVPYYLQLNLGPIAQLILKSLVPNYQTPPQLLHPAVTQLL